MFSMLSGICQGISWQDMHQPCVAGSTYIPEALGSTSDLVSRSYDLR